MVNKSIIRASVTGGRRRLDIRCRTSNSAVGRHIVAPITPMREAYVSSPACIGTGTVSVVQASARRDAACIVILQDIEPPGSQSSSHEEHALSTNTKRAGRNNIPGERMAGIYWPPRSNSGLPLDRRQDMKCDKQAWARRLSPDKLDGRFHKPFMTMTYVVRDA